MYNLVLLTGKVTAEWNCSILLTYTGFYADAFIIQAQAFSSCVLAVGILILKSNVQVEVGAAM